MMRFLRTLKDDRGVAALEFALILPLLLGLLLLGVDGWMRINQASAMASAVQTGARYYEGGGSDDTAAAQLALSGWRNPPADGTVNAQRSCTCGGVGASCSSLCTGNTLPKTYVTITASGTYTGLMHAQPLRQTGVVRVR